MALSLHELATNACKHGAWSGEEGVVEIRGESGEGAETMLWTERGGATTQRKERALIESGGLKLVRGFARTAGEV
jgi:two-component sensor histidine kinase